MVAIFTGAGFGFGRGSGSVLGGAGILGSSSQGRGGEGVFLNAASGNLLISKQDEFVAGAGPDASIARTYNSLTSLADDNNDKWRQSTDRRLTGFPATYGAAGSTIKRIAGDGSEITYVWNANWRGQQGVQGSGAYVAIDGGGAYDTLYKSGTDWIWTDGDTNGQEVYYDDTASFGRAGLIRYYDDRTGQRINFNYQTNSARLDSVTTTDLDANGVAITGSMIQYSYDSNGNITQATTSYIDFQTSTSKTLTRVRYGYESYVEASVTKWRLNKVTVDLSPEDNSIADDNPAGTRTVYETFYGYDSNNRVNLITQTDGSSLAITYDGSGRVLTLTQLASGGTSRVTSLSYGAGFTTVQDPTGTVTRLDFDANGNLIKITAPPAYAGAAQQIVQFAYNTNGDLISSTDALGKTTTYSDFTVYGLARTITRPDGSVLTRTYGSVNTGATPYTYNNTYIYAATDDAVNKTNLLLSETVTGVDASGSSVSQTTRYVYNQYGDLIFKITPEGRVTEYTYFKRLLSSEIAYSEASYSAAGTPTLGDMTTWRNALADKTAKVVTKYGRDGRGNISSISSFASFTAAGADDSSNGLNQTYYVYDQAGQLIKSYHKDYNGATAYNSLVNVYDGMGRIKAVTDLSGSTTTFAFNDGATTTTVTSASGYVVTKTYNKAGDLISETDSGTNTVGGTTLYAYDKLGRVRVRTDAHNATKTYFVYDDAGRKVGELDALGYLTEFRYDGDNRLIGTIQYRNVSLANLTSLADPDAAVTIAAIRPTADVQDISSWVIYDDLGRVRQTIAGDGSTSISEYDGAGRLQKITAYAAKLSAATMAKIFADAADAITITRTVSAPATGSDAVARNFYDKDGRLIAALDSEGYLTQSTYDKAGRLVATTTFAKAAAAGLRATASLNALVADIGTNAADRTTRMVYDSSNLLRFQIDALGQVTEYSYSNHLGKIASETRYDAALAAQSSYSFLSIKNAVSTLGNSANRRTTYYTYDQAERLAFTVDATGGVTGLSYDSYGNLTKSVRFAAANVLASQPTNEGLKTWAAANGTNTANQVTRTWYNERGEAAYSVNAEGFVTRAVYNADGRKLSETSWADAVSVSDTATLAQLQALLGTNSVTHYWDYDSLGRVVRETNGVGTQTAYAYSGTTSLIAARIVADNGTATEKRTDIFSYDGAGRQIQSTVAQGTSEAATSASSFDGRGNLLSTTDPRLNVTTYTYDLSGRVKTVTDALGGVTNYDYNAFGEAWKVTDARGTATYSWFDRLGRVIASRDGGDYLTSTSYTVFGEIANVTRWQSATVSAIPASSLDPLPTMSGPSAVTSFTYDKLGRVVSTSDALSYVEAFSYDMLGNRLTRTNKLNGVTTFAYDRLGRLIRQGQAAVTTNYPVSGNYSAGALQSATATTGAENVTTFSYDAFGNLKQKVEGYATSLGGAVTALRTTSYTYDAANQVIQTTHDAVTVIADDMASISSATPSESLVYDRRGNVIKFVDAAGASTFSYFDALNRRTAEIKQLAANQWVYTAYTYDAGGNLTSTKVYEGNPYPTGTPPQGGTAPSAPSGIYRETAFTYDNLGQMTASTVVSNGANAITSGSWNGSAYVSASGNLTTTYQFDANGNVVKLIDPNGNATWSWYDKLNRKVAQLDGEGYLTQWNYNAEGSVTQETRFSAKFTGTPALSAPPTLSASGDDRTTLYTYDLNGNRTTETRLNVAAWTVDASTGALAAAASTSATIEYTYNALGQVLTKKEPTGLAAGSSTTIASYAYDNTGRLTSESRAAFVDANGTTVTPTTAYAYDSIGDLITTSQAGTASGTYQALSRVTTNRYGEGGRLLSSTDAEGNAHQYFYDVAGRLKKDAYARVVNADNSAASASLSTISEAKGRFYDLAGRALTEAVYSTISGSLQRIDFASYQYNNFGQVVAQGSGSDSASGINSGIARYQVQNQYDAAGRLVATNSGDGVWKYLGYDKLGNQTIAITSAGYALTSSTGFAAALANVGLATLNATYTVYDKRNMAVQVVEEGRDLSATQTNQTLTSSRAYNAFGEVVSETNALGATTSYVYNTMGRRTRSEAPAVETVDGAGTSYWIKPSQDFYYDLAGRMIASRDANGTYASGGSNAATATSKAANTGNLTTLALLAGTGYDGKQALITTEFHSDGGKKQTLFDVMGDARVVRDELFNAANPNLHVTEQSFNRLGQLTAIKHNRTTDVADDSTRLIDNYVYDQFGQRIQHTNNLYGATGIEKTAFDALGRTTAQTDMAGYLTTTSYAWDGTLTASGLSALGGWAETTQYYHSGVLAKSKLEKTDIYGRFVTKTDLGGHVTSFGYNGAAQLITSTVGSQTTTFAYYNTGQLASNNGIYGLATYTYDKAGNRVSEKLVNNSVTVKDATASYDALGRLTGWNQLAGSSGFAGSLTHKYDANGNILRTLQSYTSMQSDGTAGYVITNSPAVFSYDSQNRLTYENGTTKLYDLSGRLVRESQARQLPVQVPNPDWPNDKTMGQYLTYYYTGQFWTNYNYNPDGTLASVTEQTEGGYYDELDNTAYATGSMGSPITRSTFSYDKLGRAVAQSDYSANGLTVVYSRSATFNAAGQITWESTSTKRDNNNTYGLTNSYGYGSGSGYALGSVLTISSSSTVNGGSLTSSSESTSYAWYDGGVQSQIDYTPDIANSGTIYHSYVTINALGQQASVSIQDGRPRTVSYISDENGQILRRDEVQAGSSLGPHEQWYRYGGKQMAFTGNNYETGKLDYGSSIAQRRTNPGTGMFRDGMTYGSGASNVDFTQTPDAINSYSQGSGYGTYTVHQGDSLQGIAQAVWGDANLWYKLAEANGLGAGAQLNEGQSLILPAGVRSVSHNASTFKPYNSAEALGDITPSAPKPPKKNNCGVFGQILLMVIAIAVTAVLKVPMTGLLGGSQVAGYAAAGAVGSIVSQGVGVATGIQDKFSWSAVAMAGIGAGVGEVLGGIPGLDKVFGSPFLGDVVRGALGSAITQGIGVATGLQDKFSWAGVAAAGLGAGVGSGLARELGKAMPFSPIFAEGQIGNDILSTAASTLANAATRSVLEGSDFGDNIMAALPDAIGGVLGRALGGVANNAIAEANAKAAEAKANASAEKVDTVGNEAQDAATDYKQIVVTANYRRSTNFMNYVSMTNVDVDLLNYEISEYGIEFAASNLHRKIVRGLVDAKNAVSTIDLKSKSGWDAVCSLNGDSNCALTDGGWAATDFEIRVRRNEAWAALQSGGINEKTYADITRSIDANVLLINKWNAIADQEVAKILFVGVGAPLAAAGTVASGGALLAGGLSLGGGAGFLVSVDYLQAHGRGIANRSFEVQSTVGGSVITYGSQHLGINQMLGYNVDGERTYALANILAGGIGIAKGAYSARLGSSVAAESAVPEGVVYSRIDLNGEVLPYGGQAKSYERYLERQVEHARAYPDADFEFTIVDRASPGVDLDVAEHTYIQELTGGVRASKSSLVSNLKDPVGPARRPDLGLPEPRGK